MNPDIQRRWEGIEARREALVQRVRDLDGPTRITRPAPGLLSPLEVIKHMALSEEHGLEAMKKHPPNTLKRVKVGRFYREMLTSMQNPTRVLPTLPKMLPKGKVDLEEAAKEWERVRRLMVPYLASCETLKSPLIKQMFLIGTLSCEDYIALLEAHHHYHEVRLTKGDG